MTFRNILRDSTRPQHDALDDLLSSLDIAQHEDFSSFAEIHLVCFQKIHGCANGVGYALQLLSDMVRCLRSDLAVLGHPSSSTPPAPYPTLDPLAVDYIVAGSRLGSKVLKKRWLMSDDATVQGADSYFSLAVDASFWPDTCRKLDEISPGSARAAAIIKDTQAMFDLFSTAYNDTIKTKVVV